LWWVEYLIDSTIDDKIILLLFKWALREARPAEPVRTGIAAKILFCWAARKKDCSARPDEALRTGIARPLASANWRLRARHNKSTQLPS